MRTVEIVVDETSEKGRTMYIQIRTVQIVPSQVMYTCGQEIYVHTSIDN
jgi:hypothetical protein